MYGFILEPSPMSSEILEAELQQDGVVVILGADGIQYLLAERRQGSGGVYPDVLEAEDVGCAVYSYQARDDVEFQSRYCQF